MVEKTRPAPTGSASPTSTIGTPWSHATLPNSDRWLERVRFAGSPVGEQRRRSDGVSDAHRGSAAVSVRERTVAPFGGFVGQSTIPFFGTASS